MPELILLEVYVMQSLPISREQWEHGPKIVAVGGGTGLSTMLRGLKKYTKT